MLTATTYDIRIYAYNYNCNLVTTAPYNPQTYHYNLKPYNMERDQIEWPERANQCLFFILEWRLTRKGIYRGVVLILDRQGRETMFPNDSHWFSNESRGFIRGSLLARKENRRDAVFYFGTTRPGNVVFPMVFEGFRITIRFPMRRRGTQRDAPYAICWDMEKRSFSNGFRDMAL